jgi:hypothetical protein
MNFTFERSERSSEENQERAYIAASKRADRTYAERLRSLEEASKLHYQRTGRGFMISTGQLDHRGPMMEDSADQTRIQERNTRNAPYDVDRGRQRRGQGSAGDSNSRHQGPTIENKSRSHCRVERSENPIPPPTLPSRQPESSQITQTTVNATQTTVDAVGFGDHIPPLNFHRGSTLTQSGDFGSRQTAHEERLNSPEMDNSQSRRCEVSGDEESS